MAGRCGSVVEVESMPRVLCRNLHSKMADVAGETQIEVRRIHDVAGEGFHVDEAEERRILIYVEST